MALDKLYNRQTWHNNTTPALNETNLNVLSKAVDDIDDRVIDIAGTVMETVPQVQEDLEEAQELLEDAEAINSHPPIIGQNGNWWTWDTSTNAYVDSGKDASVTVSVNPNTETLPAGSNAYVRNVGTSTDPVLLFGIPKGDKGETGGATPGSDVADTIVGEITASSATYPEPEEGETIKVIIGKIKKFLDDLKTKKADKVSSATSGNFAGLDSNGNLTDSGSKASDFLTSHQTIKQDGVTGATVNRFGTCSTSAGTAAKTVSITTGTFSLEAGARVSVKFNNANTASTPTLNVNSTGAKNIYHKGSQITSSDNKSLLAGTVDFIYDGTQFHLVGNSVIEPIYQDWYVDANNSWQRIWSVTLGNLFILQSLDCPIKKLKETLINIYENISIASEAYFCNAGNFIYNNRRGFMQIAGGIGWLEVTHYPSDDSTQPGTLMLRINKDVSTGIVTVVTDQMTSNTSFSNSPLIFKINN